MHRAGRVLFLGSHTRFSAIVLTRLLEARTPIIGILAPASGSGAGAAGAGLAAARIPVADEQSIRGLARSYGVAIDGIDGFGRAAAARVRGLAPDLVVAACFPFIVPAELLRLPARGGLNVHPSLLPAFRGPSPVFWQLRAGVEETGVTVHRMTARIDAGDILARRRLPLAAGVTASALMARLAVAGGACLVEILGAPRPPVPRRQDPARASYMGMPRPEDFHLPATWSAQRAYRFMAGAAEWRHPFTITTAAGALAADTALGVADPAECPGPVRFVGGETWIRFSPGVLRVPGIRRPGSARSRARG